MHGRRGGDLQAKAPTGIFDPILNRSPRMEGYQIQALLEMLIITFGSVTGLWIITRAILAWRGKLAPADLAQLAESITHLRDSIEGMREELGDVTERLDFNERVLARMADEAKARKELPGQ